MLRLLGQRLDEEVFVCYDPGFEDYIVVIGERSAITTNNPRMELMKFIEQQDIRI